MEIRPRTVWDLGANRGVFSAIASAQGAFTVAWDLDPVAVEAHYQATRDAADSRTPALRINLTNPTSALGWANQERKSFLERGPVDPVMGLALLHRLSIGNHVPFPMLADFFAAIGHHAIIEFVPLDDSQAARMAGDHKGAFPN